jgi:phage terminase large subunit-like protein
MSEFVPSSVLAQAHQLLDSLESHYTTNKLEVLYFKTADDGCAGGPYGWQVDWHNMGGQGFTQRAIIAGNRVGKTRTAGAEVAIHLTGLYPPWWKGHRFENPNDWICAAPTNELIRDPLQLCLFGRVAPDEREDKMLDGSGWVPKDRIGRYSFRQCGVSDVLDVVQVQHKTGGWSSVSFKSYEQGNIKFQSVARDGVWLDEEPEDELIFSECLTRIADKQGILLFTRTPLFGRSTIIKHFMSGKVGVGFALADWDRAPHIGARMRAELAESYTDHERATRISGVPMMGSGGVYPIDEKIWVCDPIQIQPWWRRIVGIDFGIDHPAAAVWLAYNPDTDTIYVYDCYKKRGEGAPYHAAAISNRGSWIPVAWPHDGMQRGKADGVPLKESYVRAGVNMLPESSRYDDETGGAQTREPITIDIYDRLRTGRLKVFRTCFELIDEMRNLHREDAKIVAKDDDAESGLRIGVMSLRFARTMAECVRAPQSQVDQDDDYNPLVSSLRRR